MKLSPTTLRHSPPLIPETPAWISSANNVKNCDSTSIVSGSSFTLRRSSLHRLESLFALPTSCFKTLSPHELSWFPFDNLKTAPRRLYCYANSSFFLYPLFCSKFDITRIHTTTSSTELPERTEITLLSMLSPFNLGRMEMALYFKYRCRFIATGIQMIQYHHLHHPLRHTLYHPIHIPLLILSIILSIILSSYSPSYSSSYSPSSS